MEDLQPNAFGGPSDEAIVEGLARSVDRWRINPATARLQHMHDAADHTVIVDTRLAARIGRKQRLKPRKLVFTEPESIATHR